MEKVRDLHNCSKCGVGFRPSAEQERLCAKCEVTAIPSINDPAELEKQFLAIAGQVYGTQSTEKLYNIFGLADIFNHKQRLQKLMEDLETGNSRNKDRIKRRREINRLMEEHDAVQKSLADIQTKFLRKMMLDPDMQFLGSSRGKASPVSVCPSPMSPPRTSPQKASDSNNNTPVKQVKLVNRPVANTSEVVLSPVKKIETNQHDDSSSSSETLVPSSPNNTKLPESLPTENGKKKSPVKKFAEYFEKRGKLAEVAHTVKTSNSFKSNQPPLQTVKEGMSIPKILSPTKKTVVIQNLQPTTPPIPSQKEVEQEDMVVPQTPEMPDDEVFGSGFKRSNSVRDKIKGFEERIRRTASTGSSDRPTIQKRQLF